MNFAKSLLENRLNSVKINLRIQRLELLAAVSGQPRDASIVSEAKEACNSGKMVLGKIREINALRPRAAAESMNEEMSSSSPPATKKAKNGKHKW